MINLSKEIDLIHKNKMEWLDIIKDGRKDEEIIKTVEEFKLPSFSMITDLDGIDNLSVFICHHSEYSQKDITAVLHQRNSRQHDSFILEVYDAEEIFDIDNWEEESSIELESCTLEQAKAEANKKITLNLVDKLDHFQAVISRYL